MQFQDFPPLNPPISLNPPIIHHHQPPLHQWLNCFKTPLRWCKAFSPEWSIRNKIGWGYGVSLGIAVLGTGVGLTVGDYYQQEAQTRLAIAQKQGKLLSQLQLTMAQFRPEKEFIPTMRDSDRFQAARMDFQQRIQDVNSLLYQIETARLEKQDINQSFFVAFEDQIQRYVQSLDAILQTIDPAALQAEDVSTRQKALLDFVDSPTYITLFRYSTELTTLIAEAEHRDALANEGLEQARRLRIRIIGASMILSIIIAGILASRISYAIARPIQAVTEVAQQVTTDNDFTVQAPILTQDEVSTLAASLNQLIAWIAEYTRELKETQTQLIQTEKMSSLGQMVAGVAHEINNPVNFIYGNLNHTRAYTDDLLSLIRLYQQHYPNPAPEIQRRTDEIDLEFLSEDLPKLLGSMKVGADRIRQIVLSLRNFSRLDEAEMKPSDLHEGIDSTLLLLNNRLKQGINVVKQYGLLPLVPCYPAQLNQVFMNILSNAIDALQDKMDEPAILQGSYSPTITITTECHANNTVSIAIADNGEGIPPGLISKLFDPFFTTKPIGQGTGLGLAICYQIIEKHQGKIQINSSPQQGAEFVITLPVKS